MYSFGDITKTCHGLSLFGAHTIREFVQYYTIVEVGRFLVIPDLLGDMELFQVILNKVRKDIQYLVKKCGDEHFSVGLKNVVI